MNAAVVMGARPARVGKDDRLPQVLSPEAVALLLHLAFSRVPSAGQPRPRRRLPPLGDRHVGTFEAPGRHRPNLLGRRQHRSDNR
jgi:hypothetical protein